MQKENGPTWATGERLEDRRLLTNTMPRRKNGGKRERFNPRTKISADSSNAFDGIDELPSVGT